MLQWARQNGCPWDEDTCASAAEGGHLEVLQWARQNGCPWDETPVHRQQKEATWRCSNGPARMAAPGMRLPVPSAAEGGHLEVLQWAHQNGCPWDEQTCAEAARGGHLEVLQWARAEWLPLG